MAGAGTAGGKRGRVAVSGERITSLDRFPGAVSLLTADPGQCLPAASSHRTMRVHSQGMIAPLVDALRSLPAVTRLLDAVASGNIRFDATRTTCGAP
ncbi:hypothetical protein [Streptomyces sp. NPDC058295]|uniref:hypothetical protein n=1 Tax=Streptomyces sp. NPDC058295 TaxID=3346431 RepID=UPI0036F00C39